MCLPSGIQLVVPFLPRSVVRDVHSKHSAQRMIHEGVFSRKQLQRCRGRWAVKASCHYRHTVIRPWMPTESDYAVVQVFGCAGPSKAGIVHWIKNSGSGEAINHMLAQPRPVDLLCRAVFVSRFGFRSRVTRKFLRQVSNWLQNLLKLGSLRQGLGRDSETEACPTVRCSSDKIGGR